MDKIKEMQSASEALADAMGWPRRKVNAEWAQAVVKDGGRITVDLTLPIGKAAHPRKIIHRLKARKSVLDDEIELARTKAVNANSAASIFAELVKLAEHRQGCLIGVDEDAIKYQVGAEVKFFTVRHLRQRLKRANAR
jgi:hypothetical protein